MNQFIIGLLVAMFIWWNPELGPRLRESLTAEFMANPWMFVFLFLIIILLLKRNKRPD